MKLHTFIKELTDVLDTANASYAFARNYAGLTDGAAESKSDGDIDMLVTPEGQKAVVEWLTSHPTLSLMFVQHRSYVTNCFIGGVDWGKNNEFHAIQLDLAFNLSCRGINVLDIDTLLDNARPLSKDNAHIKILLPEHEFISTFITSVVVMGTKKDKYWQLWRHTLKNQTLLSQKYMAVLKSIFGVDLARRIVNCIVNTHTRQWPLLVPRLRREIVVRYGLRHPLKMIKNKLGHYGRELGLILSKQHIKCIYTPGASIEEMDTIATTLEQSAKVISVTENHKRLTLLYKVRLSRRPHILIQNTPFLWPYKAHITVEDTNNTDDLRQSIFKAFKIEPLPKD